MLHPVLGATRPCESACACRPIRRWMARPLPSISTHSSACRRDHADRSRFRWAPLAAPRAGRAASRLRRSVRASGGTISGPTMFTLADLTLWAGVLSVIGMQALAVTAPSRSFLRRPPPAASSPAARYSRPAASSSTGRAPYTARRRQSPFCMRRCAYAIPEAPSVVARISDVTADRIVGRVDHGARRARVRRARAKDPAPVGMSAGSVTIGGGGVSTATTAAATDDPSGGRVGGTVSTSMPTTTASTSDSLTDETVTARAIRSRRHDFDPSDTQHRGADTGITTFGTDKFE